MPFSSYRENRIARRGQFFLLLVVLGLISIMGMVTSVGILLISAASSRAQTANAGTRRAATVRVDTTPSRAIAFDPDKALGTSIDILPARDFDKVFTDAILKDSLSAGWGPISYRQNTELTIEAWHWNPNGTWSDDAHESGYFVGSSDPGSEPLCQSFGYALTHRGTTRSDADAVAFSRLTDGDGSTYWKSNPYLANKFTGEDDAHLPQWIVIDFGTPQQIDALRISWANPFATKYEAAYWTGEDAMNKPAAGYWTVFPSGGVENGKGGVVTLRLAESPIVTRYVQIRMTQSSNTCDTHGSSDARNCVGYAVNELYAGNFSFNGRVPRHHQAHARPGADRHVHFIRRSLAYRRRSRSHSRADRLRPFLHERPHQPFAGHGSDRHGVRQPRRQRRRNRLHRKARLPNFLRRDGRRARRRLHDSRGLRRALHSIRRRAPSC